MRTVVSRSRTSFWRDAKHVMMFDVTCSDIFMLSCASMLGCYEHVVCFFSCENLENYENCEFRSHKISCCFISGHIIL